MPFWRSEEREARSAEEWNRQLLAEEEAQRKRAAEEFDASPVGRARAAYDDELEMYQFSLPLDTVTAVPVARADDGVVHYAADVSDVLDSVVREGWELHSFSTVFALRTASLAGGETRRADVSGDLVATYVFVREETSHAPLQVPAGST
ncbi:hypothetical protein [Pseudonocardia sp. N23]|uniref:hypothetical protein n=1 Tax=Pseudonocardia sp. N23 TaxID=1987376 RepID=UPI000BFD0FE3|nr:hypothetical protein [Pseudonocardia sp. N23]GAY11024.1 hypothetical protein TOK_5509 [Pseudonocardia sp. N23]